MSDPQQPDPAKKPTTEPGSGTADEVTGPIPTGPVPTGPIPTGTAAAGAGPATGSGTSDAGSGASGTADAGAAGTTGAGATGIAGATGTTGAGTPGSAGAAAKGGAGSTAKAGTGSTATAEEGNGGDGKGGGDGGKGAKGGKRPERPRTNPWLIVGAVAAAVVFLAALGYFGGLGPLNRLSTERGIDPPAKLAGLDRITDPKTRSDLELDRTRENLVRINKGKEATVEAYSNQARDRIFVVVALRGRVDRDKYVKDAGATPEQVKTIGKATCVTPEANLSTQCYRGSNTLTVIVQVANENVTVDAVAPVAAEAFEQMK